MARSAADSITIFDVVDGTDPIVAYQTNPTHTFIAAADGAVTASNLNAFEDFIFCYIGDSKATPSSATSDSAMANSSFRLSSTSADGSPVTISASGWPAGSNWGVANQSNNSIRLKGPNSALAASSADTAQATLHIRVKNAAGTVSTVDQPIFFTKAIAGGSTNVITLSGTDNVFTANSAGTLDSSQSNIIIDIGTQGSPGNRTYEVSVNGGAFVARTATNAGAGQIAAYDADTSGTVETTGTISATAARLAISSANLGSNDTMQIRVKGANGGQDVYNIVKIKEGTPAENAIVVVVSSNRGDVFSSSDTNDKTLTARVYDQSTGNEITSGITYDWRLGDPGSTTRVKVDGSNNVVSSGGSNATSKTIIIGDEDVSISQQYSCIVTVT